MARPKSALCSLPVFVKKTKMVSAKSGSEDLFSVCYVLQEYLHVLVSVVYPSGDTYVKICHATTRAYTAARKRHPARNTRPYYSNAVAPHANPNEDSRDVLGCSSESRRKHTAVACHCAVVKSGMLQVELRKRVQFEAPPHRTAIPSGWWRNDLSVPTCDRVGLPVPVSLMVHLHVCRALPLFCFVMTWRHRKQRLEKKTVRSFSLFYWQD